MSTPPRSRLYHLKPIGVGTPSVESLTGYIIRLAEAHHVTPKQLIVGILPFHSGRKFSTNYYSDPYGGFWAKALELNGSGLLAQEWVETLQILTAQNNLHSLTLLPWKEDLSDEDHYLRFYQAWCPGCYEEQRQNHQVIYEPLLWALKEVRLCLQHEQELVSLCPHCGAGFFYSRLQPHRGAGLFSPRRHVLPGYCPKCTGWLGVTRSKAGHHPRVYDAEERKYQQLIVLSLSESLASGRLFPPTPTKAKRGLADQALLKRAENPHAEAILKAMGFT